jgi:hypothetical protein
MSRRSSAGLPTATLRWPVGSPAKPALITAIRRQRKFTFAFPAEAPCGRRLKPLQSREWRGALAVISRALRQRHARAPLRLARKHGVEAVCRGRRILSAPSDLITSSAAAWHCRSIS